MTRHLGPERRPEGHLRSAGGPQVITEVAGAMEPARQLAELAELEVTRVTQVTEAAAAAAALLPTRSIKGQRNVAGYVRTPSHIPIFSTYLP